MNLKQKNKPLISTLDGPWGFGKTAFIDIWGQSLLNENKIAIKFDAWKADYTVFPLMALIIQFTDQLNSQVNSKANIESIKKFGKNSMRGFFTRINQFWH